MKDILKAYKKQTLIRNTGIVLTSLAVALGVHTFVLDGNIGNYIKANVLEIPLSAQNSDIFLTTQSGAISLAASKTMKDVSTLSFSLLYDAENTTIENFQTVSNGADITRISNEPGLATLIINFTESRTLPKGEEILRFTAEKSSENTAYINILNANFTDAENGEYLLTTSGIMY